MDMALRGEPMSGIRVVAPFRPFPPEGILHTQMPDFDWIAAIRLLQASVEQSCPSATFHVITDVDTDLPLPTLQYVTTRRRLMLWTLEACLRYLDSDDFDRDSVMLDCDQLVYGDLSHLVSANVDLMVCIRPMEKQRQNPAAMPILNGVQVWRHRAKAALIAFYTQALMVAEGLPEARIVWGADTDALRILLEPIEPGMHTRGGLTVNMRDANAVLEPCSNVHRKWLEQGREFWPSRPVVDFRWKRKDFQRPFFEATYGRKGVACV
jgi:hypothetical protein